MFHSKYVYLSLFSISQQCRSLNLLSLSYFFHSHCLLFFFLFIILFLFPFLTLFSCFVSLSHHFSFLHHFYFFTLFTTPCSFQKLIKFERKIFEEFFKLVLINAIISDETNYFAPGSLSVEKERGEKKKTR